VVNRFSKTKNIVVRIEVHNTGAQVAVLEAVKWALGFEDNIIVLEDDSTLNENSLRYFDQNQYLLKSKDIRILGGRSINQLSTITDVSKPKLFVASFPLTNGWSINRESWKLLTVTATKREILRAILRSFFKQIDMLKVFCFFAAGNYRFKYRIGKAGWDSMIAFNFIVFKYKCVIPSVNVIGNNGFDKVASNTIMQKGETQEDFIKLGHFNDDFSLTRNRDLEKEIDSFIINEVYGVKKYHLLSPIKAFVERITFSK